ncbi:MAG TPA: xanthine dehydrogenase family protein subunit M [Dehalococcoidia bacterium]|nr:xanthine dehydrogenase family protein subunit M [Dehalococcoidia bacterium]
MRGFEYYAPHSLEEAFSLLDNRREKAKVLAGGTDLIVQMKNGNARPAVIVDAKKIPELNRLEWIEDGTLHIGAAVPLSKIITCPPVMEKFGILYQACSIIGSMQLRNRGTVGGNICNAAPSADSAPPLLCLGAKAIVARLGGYRIVPLDSFFHGPGQTALAPNELLVGIEIPAPPTRSSGCYLRHTPRQDMDIAVVGVASFLVISKQNNLCQEARIALGAVAPTPIRVPQAESILAGRVLTEEAIEEAAERAVEAARPISDVRGSAEYRKEIVKVLTRRTLKRAWDAQVARINNRD